MDHRVFRLDPLDSHWCLDSAESDRRIENLTQDEGAADFGGVAQTAAEGEGCLFRCLRDTFRRYAGAGGRGAAGGGGFILAN